MQVHTVARSPVALANLVTGQPGDILFRRQFQACRDLFAGVGTRTSHAPLVKGRTTDHSSCPPVTVGVAGRLGALDRSSSP